MLRLEIINHFLVLLVIPAERNEMKKIIYFIGLKFLEITGAFVTYFLLCLLFSSNLFYFMHEGVLPFWISGLFGVVVCACTITVIAYVVTFFVWLFTKNWEIAERLSKKE
jgi:hypothetical protein